MDPDVELLIRRATPLTFGVFAQIPGANGDRITRCGGSGIFVSPFHALTARHVTRDFFEIDSTRADQLKRRLRVAEENARTDYFELPHSSLPLCMLEYEYRDMATLGGKRTFADLFNTGELRSQDWPRINDRIEKRRDEEDKPFAYIHS